MKIDAVRGRPRAKGWCTRCACERHRCRLLYGNGGVGRGGSRNEGSGRKRAKRARTGGGSSSGGAGRFFPGSGTALAACCCAAVAVYVKRSVAGRDRNNNDVVDAQNTSKARHKTGELNKRSCEHKRDAASESKRKKKASARRGESVQAVAYRAARLRLKVRLQVQGRVEIAAGVADAAALDGVHAHRDTAVIVRGHRGRRVREAALGLGALARAALELPAHLRHRPTAQRANDNTAHGRAHKQ
ncbi:hypothetical protein EVAR_13086_1 [Eumeta japonica]|uniref:Uncharacterized protein n=1 Tax=Eumeta variegata TaxID=151549 RepID=A0A4C1UAH5_EUMVA|nr:hypothetical protein EVAR_13086_1 [Eumeta japonica]